MSARPQSAGGVRIELEKSKLRTERLHLENSMIEFEVGPVGTFAKVRRDSRFEYVGPIDEETIDALYELGEREEWIGRDPFDVVPGEFKRRFDGVRHANRQLRVRKPNDEKRRCPADGCGSTAITPLSSKTVSNTAPDERWKCKKCAERFRTPLPPECECDDEDETEGDE